MKLPKLDPATAAVLAQASSIRRDPTLPFAAATHMKDGVLTVLLGESFFRCGEKAQAGILAHECAHIIFGHTFRMGNRHPMLWGAAADCVVNASPVMDLEAIEQGLSAKLITYETLSTMLGKEVPRAPAEIVYEFLLKDSPPCTTVCGLLHSTHDGTNASLARTMSAAVAARATLGAGVNPGPAGMAPEIPPAPAWIRSALLCLRRSRALSSTRSWNREHRASDLLPGQFVRRRNDALILIDRSGSIDEKSLACFLAAIVNTPELRLSRAALFDDELDGPMPVRALTPQRCFSSRGGTLYGPPAALRQPGSVTLWLTDGMPADGFPEPSSGGDVWCVTGKVALPRRYMAEIRINT